MNILFRVLARTWLDISMYRIRDIDLILSPFVALLHNRWLLMLIGDVIRRMYFNRYALQSTFGQTSFDKSTAVHPSKSCRILFVTYTHACTSAAKHIEKLLQSLLDHHWNEHISMSRRQFTNFLVTIEKIKSIRIPKKRLTFNLLSW